MRRHPCDAVVIRGGSVTRQKQSEIRGIQGDDVAVIAPTCHAACNSPQLTTRCQKSLHLRPRTFELDSSRFQIAYGAVRRTHGAALDFGTHASPRWWISLGPRGLR